MKKSFLTRLLFWFSAAVLIIIAVLALWNTLLLLKAQAEARQTLKVLVHIDQLLIDILNAETGQRGFLVTNDQRFLDPYQDASEDIEESLEELATLIRDDAEHADRLGHISQHLKSKMLELAQTIELHQQGKSKDAIAKVTSGDGRRTMDDIRGHLTSMREAERSKLAKRENAAAFRSKVVLATIILLVAFGGVALFVATRRVDREIRRRAAEQSAVEEKVRLRTVELQRAVRQVEEANEAKSQFLAMMSHELRTPLNTVTGFTDLLLSTELSGEQKEYIESIRAGSTALLGVISEVLDFSKIEQGRVEINRDRVELPDLLGQIVSALRPAQDKKKLVSHFENSVPPVIWADHGKLRQVLLNLVANALKFADEGEVRISVYTEGEKLWFTVTDHGIGIPEDALQEIFEPFVQADSSTSRRFGGTGLGLAICKSLIEAMGGKISVESQVGVGSKFSFWIPLEACQQLSEEEIAALSAQAAAQIPKGLHVLVVEDNVVNRKLAIAMLQRLGVDVIGAKDGQECLEIWTREKIDLILMDLEMPEIDGFEATRRIRAMERDGGHSYTPIIALTADVVKGVKEKCFIAGMDDYISKPVRLEELGRSIAKLARKDPA